MECPICKKIVKGGRWQLRSHQLTSSFCLAASGRAPHAREPCEHCGRMIAADDSWAKEQHSRKCPGQSGPAARNRPQRGRSEPPDRQWWGQPEPGPGPSPPSAERWRRRQRSQSRPRERPSSRSASRRRQAAEPNWDDSATYFYRNPWEMDYVGDGEADDFSAWLDGGSTGGAPSTTGAGGQVPQAQNQNESSHQVGNPHAPAAKPTWSWRESSGHYHDQSHDWATSSESWQDNPAWQGRQWTWSDTDWHHDRHGDWSQNSWRGSDSHDHYQENYGPWDSQNSWRGSDSQDHYQDHHWQWDTTNRASESYGG